MLRRFRLFLGQCACILFLCAIIAKYKKIGKIFTLKGQSSENIKLWSVDQAGSNDEKKEVENLVGLSLYGLEAIT